MTNQHKENKRDTLDVLQHIQTILSDGHPRTTKAIIDELQRFDVRLGAVEIEHLLRTATHNEIAYDQSTGTFSLIKPPTITNSQPTPLLQPVPSQQPKFMLRQRVQLVADPVRYGRIVDGPRLYDNQYEYCVVFGDQEGWYREDDLQAIPLDGLPRWEKHDEFLRDLLLVKLRNRLTDSLYSYRASRTQFVPYQFRPVLKFLRNPEQRILIADEVGLGKTIEAAIIYLELKARLNINRVLVLCPSRLKAKWRAELRNRFEEEFIELDTQRLRTLLADSRRLNGRYPFKAIVSFETMRLPEFIDAWTTNQMQLDLLIVDEAHHLRNQDTRTFELGVALTDSADAVVFLTATPLHLGNRDLFNLLHLLSPGEYFSPELFKAQIEPNEAVNRAARYLAAGNTRAAEHALRQVERSKLRDRFLRNPYYHEVLHRLRNGVATDRDRVMLQRELYELNTLSNIFTRTRKREVMQAAVRAAYTICVDLTPNERRFYQAVLASVQQELSLRSGAQSFASIMKERQAASCLAALREALLEADQGQMVPNLNIDQSAFDVLNDSSTFGDSALPITTSSHLRSYALQLGDHDSKFAKFEQMLRQALAETPDSKVLVFSFFRRTLAYIQRQLQAQGFVVEMLNGDVPIAERKRIIDRFRNDPSIRIMLSSEVGSEGLDFQFCDILVNYDLPWNPMQVEQRIGRLDRFGQQHKKIRIYNLYITDTIETRIFQRLYDRIGIFERSIGDLEAILGEQIKQLSEAALQPNLTPEEQEQMAEEAAQRVLRYQIEVEELDQQKDQLLGQEAIFNQQIQATVDSGRVIAPEEVCALVKTFLADRFPQVNFVRDEEEACYTLRMTADLRAYLEQHFVADARDNLYDGRFLEAIQHNVIPLTFDSELARQRPLLEFVTIHHPLAEAAAKYWQQKLHGGVPATSIQLEGPASETGDGYFFIYQLSVNGAQPQHMLHAVIIMDDGRMAVSTAETLLRQLQLGRDTKGIHYSEQGFLAAQQQADREIARWRDQLRTETLRRNTALIAAQKASLQTSFAAKIRRAEEQGQHTTNERIRRMRQAQARNLQATLDAKLAALEEKGKVSVSYTLIAGGRTRIIASAHTATSLVRPSVETDTPKHKQTEVHTSDKPIRDDLGPQARLLPSTHRQASPPPTANLPQSYTKDLGSKRCLLSRARKLFDRFLGRNR